MSSSFTAAPVDWTGSWCSVAEFAAGRSVAAASAPDSAGRFKSSFDSLREMFGCSETNKLHIIFNHVEDFIEEVRRPLGEYSEQELESSHSKFAQIWSRFKVKQLQDLGLKCSAW